MTWILILNDMRGRCEDMRPVARAETKEALVAFMEREREPWEDTGEKHQLHDTDSEARVRGPFVERIPSYRWNKTFRKGGPLEWFNPPFGDSPENFWNVGTEEDFAEQGRQAYRNKILPILEVFP